MGSLKFNMVIMINFFILTKLPLGIGSILGEGFVVYEQSI